MKENQEYYGAGMPITTGDGKQIRERRAKKLTTVIDKIYELDRRHIDLLIAQDAEGLRELAKEYDMLGMYDSASRIRKQTSGMRSIKL